MPDLTRTVLRAQKVASLAGRTTNLVAAIRASEKFRDHSMIPRPQFIDNLTLAMRETPPEGDVVECGAWRGGMSRALAEVFGPGRRYHLFDSFEGLPDTTDKDGQRARDRMELRPDERNVAEESIARGLFEGGGYDVEFHAGWFSDTVPKFDQSRRIALLRLDGDWYDSTMQCLRGLAPLLVPGGLVIIDDYYAWDGCTRAVHEYLTEIESSAHIKQTQLKTAYINDLAGSARQG